MATTIQKPQHPAQMDPRLRRAVYAKYREMLVSKNSQANEMIKQLPAYMVHQDQGFHGNIMKDVPPPPPPLMGNIPAKKLQTQMAEAPACVQNAMMTKDKKPFTYTPGGIDLSQIKSPRMAKRISANANSPGVQPKVSPLAQNSSNGSSSSQPQTAQTPTIQMTPGSVPPPPPPPPSMGSLAMGMPFQVFPTGPAVGKNNQQLSAPQSNGNARKSPQAFEPPPMGCRPEIKIPENPMATLRRAPRPQPKGDFWVQEYVQEKQRESIPSEEQLRQEFASSPMIQQQTTPQSAQFQRQQSPLRFPQRTPSPPERDFSSQMRNVKLEDVRTASPVQVHRSSPVASYSPVPASLPSPAVSAKSVTMEPLTPKTPNQGYQSPMSFQQPSPQIYQIPVQPSYQQQPTQQVYQVPVQQQQAPAAGGGRVILSTMPNKSQQQAQQHLGSLYIPPPMSQDDKEYLLSQQSPPWMSTKKALETPEWVNRDEVDNFINQTRMMHTPQTAGPQEHFVPMSLEKTPIKTPITPGFGPTPFYGANQQQFNNVVSPKTDPNANQFVNQGYNNIDFATGQPQQQQQQAPRTYAQAQAQKPPQVQFQPQQAGTRIIPIQVEGARTPIGDNIVVMQSDPRSPASPRMNPFGGPPVQSRSFKILQQVTNTFGDDSDENEAEQQRIDSEPMREQQPLFSRPLGPDEMNENQMRRMQLSDEDSYLHCAHDPRLQQPSSGGGRIIMSTMPKTLKVSTDAASQGDQPHLYQGAAIPSRSFKMLQAMTQPENAADSNDNSDIEVPPTVPQPMLPPPQYYYDWYDPQNNPYWAYYCQGFDPNSFGYPPPSRSRSQTPQPSMPPNVPPMPPNGSVPYFYPYPPLPPYMWPYPPPPFMGFRPISASRETTPCMSESERHMKTPTNDDRNRRAVSCTPTCCQHAKPVMVEENRNKFHTVEEPLINLNPISMSANDFEEEEERSENPLNCDRSLRRSLKSIPSVGNIHLLTEECGDLPLDELRAKPIIEDESDDESEVTEGDDEISQDTATQELHYPHQLSVIYEDDESVKNERRSSIVSRCSTLSDCSTTLMEEDNISVDYSADELEEENSNSVTVRLPLKFSFTRSKDNLVNTTLTVGESESEVFENSSKGSDRADVVTNDSLKDLSKLSKDSSNDWSSEMKESTKDVPTKLPNEPPAAAAPAADVSVTFRLKSKSRTPERVIENRLSFVNSSIEIDSDPDCSVSISLPRRPRIDSLKNEEKSENSGDNKKNIDSSLYTSLDAFEEIKRGMAEINNSLCSKICTLRKSALNIPSNDPYRSSSTSQIESIDTDSENDLSLSFDECNQGRKQSWAEENGIIEEEVVDEEVREEVAEESNQNQNNEDDADFWGQLSSANKYYEDDAPYLSKTSTRSSRYWFEDEDPVAEIGGDLQMKLEEVAKKDAEIEILNEKNNSEFNKFISDKLEEPQRKSSGEINFWDDYDEDRGQFMAGDNELEEPEEETNERDLIELDIKTVDKRAEEAPQQTNCDNELASDEEWTEEEVTDDEELPQSTPPKPQAVVVAAPATQMPAQEIDDESEYEEESYESEEEEPQIVQQVTQKPPVVPTQKPVTIQSEPNPETSEEESDDDDDEVEAMPLSNKSSSSRITKGKSLVNVSSYAAITSSKDKIPQLPTILPAADDSDETEYSSAEESEADEPALPAATNEHSNDDDCQVLTRDQANCHDDKVLMPSLTTIKSIDSKSNMTSESGISFEHSEDGYEEDSDEELPPNQQMEVEKPSELPEVEEENQVKVNVKGKISMFERAMSEEPSERSVKDVPRVQARYSFKHRESSEPPVSQTNYQKPKNETHAPRAVSEAKETVKNHKLLDLINQRKSLPPSTETDEQQRKSVMERISSIETESDASERRESFKRYGNSKKSMPLVRSIDESGEEDSGVTSDFCKQFSENETDTENFPELRKLSRYQRASTHSRLFKLLQGDEDVEGSPEPAEEKETPAVKAEHAPIPYKSKKIIHNVSVTRRQNPRAALEAETMEERRQRLCLPLSHQSSSGADSMSSSTTPSPTPGVNEKLVNELVQSLLSQKKGRMFKNLPIEKLHAAAVKILQEDIDSNGTFSSADESTIPTVDSTPALTPQEFRNGGSYAEYYDSWENKNEQLLEDEFSDLNLIQSKAFKNLQEQQVSASKKLWSVRCPRILSSKSINKDLARLSEVRESESPEPTHSRSLSTEPMSGDRLSIHRTT